MKRLSSLQLRFLAMLLTGIFPGFQTKAQAPVIQGKLNIAPALLQQMQNAWQNNPALAGSNKITVELWQATYEPDKSHQSTTDIHLTSRIPATIAYNAQSDGISYQISGPSLPNNTVVIAYTPALAPAIQLLVKGSPNDGGAHPPNQAYLSDVKRKLNSAYGSNIVYGIYSIIPQRSNLQQVNFSFGTGAGNTNCKTCFGLNDIGKVVGDIGDVFKKVINGVEHTFDQTINGIGDLAKCAVNDIKGIGDATGFFINSAGQYFYYGAMGLVNLVIHGDFPKTRSIRQDEYEWANRLIFNYTLPQSDHIKIFNFTSNDKHRFFTWPGIGTDIYMNLGDEAFNNPMTYIPPQTCYKQPGQVFIHELTHAWQIYNYGPPKMAQRYFSEGGNSAANYELKCPPNTINTSFKIEQEATLTDRTYAEIYYGAKTHPEDCDFCDFEKAWVETHIRKNVHFDEGNVIAFAMKKYVAEKSLSNFVGTLSNAAPAHSPGNGKDGDGYFLLGSVPWSVVYYFNKQCYANWGEIRKKYNSLNAERGILGWPQNTISGGLRNNGLFEHFQHGSIYSSSLGTYVVEELILNEWAKHNWERGALGYPIADKANSIQKFEHGYIQEQVTVSTNNQMVWTTTVHLDSEQKSTLQKPANSRFINPQPLPPKGPK